MSKQSSLKLPPYVVRKHGGEWHARLSFPTGEKSKAGKPVYVQITRKVEPKTFARAEEVVNAIRSSVVTHKSADCPDTLAEYLKRFLETKALTVTERTSEGYQYLREKFVEHSALGRRPIDEIAVKDLQRFYDGLLRSKTSPSMLRKLHVLLSMMFKQAVLWNDLTVSPMRGLMIPKVDQEESRAFTVEEAKRFVAACQTSEDYLIFEFGLMTGLRPQELVAVRWSDINLAKRTVAVKQAAAFSLSGSSTIKAPKTKQSVRTVSFTENVKRRLMQLQASQDKAIADLKAKIAAPVMKRDKGVAYERRLRIRKHAQERLATILKNDLVFPNHDGEVMRLNNLNRREFKAVLKLAKIDSGFSIKNLRHSNASMLADTLSPRKLQQHLGHRRIETTLRWYVHVHDDAHEASGMMGDLLY